MDGLPVFASTRETLGELRRKWPALLTALLLPAMAISAVEAVGLRYPDEFPYSLLFWTLGTPFYVLFAVVCHRTVILGSSSLPSIFGLFWSERETRFLGWTIALIFLSWGFGLVIGILVLLLPSSVLGMSTPWLPYLVVGLLVLYFYARLAMLFPATAVDQNTSLTDTWYLTAGNGIRLMGAILLPVAPFILVFVGLSYLFGGTESTPYLVLSEFFMHLTTAVAICAISVAYRRLASLDIVGVGA